MAPYVHGHYLSVCWECLYSYFFCFSKYLSGLQTTSAEILNLLLNAVRHSILLQSDSMLFVFTVTQIFELYLINERKG